MTDATHTTDPSRGSDPKRTVRALYALCFFCFSIGLVTAPVFHSAIDATYLQNWPNAVKWASVLSVLWATLAYVVWRNLRRALGAS